MIFKQYIALCFHHVSLPTCWVSISHYVIHMCTTWGLVKPRRQTELLGFSPPVLKNSECDGWMRITFHFLSCLWRCKALSVSRRSMQIHTHTHTHDIQTLIQIYLAVESNEKWKLLKSASPFRFIIPLKPCSNVIKIPPTAEKAGIINREVVRMYHNASFRH